MKWLKAPIGELCSSTGVRDPREEPGKPFRYVDISSIDRELKTIVQASEIIGEDAPSRARKEIQSGDILVSTVRPNLNAVAIVPSDLDKQIVSTGFCVLRPAPNKINTRYLFYYTVTKHFISALTARVRGAHYPAVSDNDVTSIEVPLPPLSEQQRVVEILDQTDALRKKRAEADAKAGRILPALFYKMFGDPLDNPKGWDTTTLSNGGALVRYGLGQPPKADTSGVPLIRATNIRRGMISTSDMMFVSQASVPRNRNAFLSSDEVIVVRSGAYTGDVAQVTDRWAGSVAGYDLIVTPGKEFCGEYIEAYLLTPHIQNNYFGNLKARAGQPHLNASQLSAAPILRPPKDLQLRYAEDTRNIRQLRERLLHCKQRLDRLFNVLLHRAFSGDLTNKWREAHMKKLLVEIEEQSKVLKDLPKVN